MRVDFLKQLNQLLLTVSTGWGTKGLIINNHTQSAKEIRIQIDALSRYFTFIQLSEIASYPFRKHCRPFCLLTFDDGKQINFEAAQELAKSGIPAVFYLVTDFIDSNKALWFDDLYALKKHYPDAIAEFGLETPKSLPMDSLVERLENAKSKYAAKADLRDPKVGPLTWSEARELANQGFVIGAHTTRHCILTNESPEMAKTEIATSIQKVSHMIGQACTTFAFPNGNYSSDLVDCAHACGATSIMTTEPLWVATKHDSICTLPRIQLADHQTEDIMLTKINVSRLGFALRNPDGTNREYAMRRLRHRLRNN